MFFCRSFNLILATVVNNIGLFNGAGCDQLKLYCFFFWIRLTLSCVSYYYAVFCLWYRFVGSWWGGLRLSCGCSFSRSASQHTFALFHMVSHRAIRPSFSWTLCQSRASMYSAFCPSIGGGIGHGINWFIYGMGWWGCGIYGRVLWPAPWRLSFLLLVSRR